MLQPPHLAARCGHWSTLTSKDKGKGLTFPRQVLLAVLRLLGDPHLRQDESGSVPDLGNMAMRAGLTPQPRRVGLQPPCHPDSRCSASGC